MLFLFMNIETKLKEILSNKTTSPFLFLGSGFSRRYIGLEKWDELLKVFAKKVNKPFGYYTSTANGDLPTVASMIAEDFQKIVWDNVEYNDFCNLHGEKFNNTESAFKYAISDYLAKKIKPTLSDYSELQDEIDILKQLDIDSIITTNWDTFIDQLFPDYKVFIGQEELLFSDSILMGEIFKIHGSINAPETLVVTKRDYDSFADKNPYLAAKLITIFVEHPIIFIGYSLNDPNIRNIISSIISCLNTEKLEKLRNNLIFVDYKSDKDTKPNIKESSMVIGDINLPITIISANSFLPIYKAIKSMHRKIPAKVLRCCKEQFYELVLTNNPKGKMAVLDADKIDSNTEIEFLLGVGVVGNQPSSIGYKSISVHEIIKDILDIDKTPLDSESILRDSIPTCQGFVPRHKYLHEIGIKSFDDLNKSPFKDLEIYTKEKLENSQERKRFFKKNNKWNISDVIRNCNKDDACKKLIYPSIDSEEDITKLKLFLINNYEYFMVEKNSYRSYYRKLVCYYDKLTYGFK